MADDQLIVRGIATTFNRDSCHQRPVRLMPGCMDVYKAIPLHFDHEVDRVCYASTYDRSLKICMDRRCVAFEATLAPTRRNAGLAKMIRGGEFGFCSIGWLDHECTDQAECTIVNRASLIEISVTSSPAFPGTSCWMVDQERDGSMAPHAIAGRARFYAARYATIGKKSGTARTSARTTATGKRVVDIEHLNKIRAVLSMPRPVAAIIPKVWSP